MRSQRGMTTKLGLIPLLVLGWAAQAGAVPITTFSGPLHSRSNISANSVGLPAGDRQWVAIQAFPTAGTTVTASQDGVIRPLPFHPATANPNWFYSLDPFDPTLTGSWVLTATNGPDSAGPIATNLILNPQLVPLAQNPQVFGTGATPTLTWGVPDLTGFDVELTRIYVFNDATNDWIYTSVTLPTTATQFTIPSGVLFPGVPYVFSVGLEDTDFLAPIENASYSLTQFAYYVPEPTTAILLGLGLSGLAISGRGRRGKATRDPAAAVSRRGGRVGRIAFSAIFLVAAILISAEPVSAAPAFLAFESGPVRPMALSADGSRLYAVNTPDGQLEVFGVDASGLTPLRSIPVGQEPVAVAVLSESEVWVVNHLSDSVSIVDPTAGVVLRTLLVGDEPRDIVFAGPAGDRAFITTAHRGQHRTHSSLAAVPGAGDPQLTTEGIGRADVWVFDAANLGGTLGGTPLRIMTVFGDTPRALARSVDGTKVWVAIHHSGNRTAAISNELVCDGFSQTTPCWVQFLINSPGGVPGPAQNVEGFAAPEVGLIAQQGSDGQWRDVLGRIWNSGPVYGPHVRFSLPDLDVFEFDATALTQTQSHAGVGTTLFNMAVNPVSGKVYVSNTDSKNLAKFEGPGITGGSTVQGHLAETQITVIDGTSVFPRHLNKHIDYATLAGDPGFDPTQKNHSLATPLEMAVSSDGATLYVAAFGSSRVGVIPTAVLESNTFEPTTLSSGYIDVSGGGPAGLVLDEANDRLFVYTRFDNGISMIDLASRTETRHWQFPNQEPLAVVEGRPFLYDARESSGNGEASCASCHTFGDMDQLGWDLGNPDDVLTNNPMELRFPPAVVPPGVNGVGITNVFHPMKGPMTTQTLRGMQHGGAMHWRGDRSNGFFGASPDDEDLAFRNFIVAFEGLLGRETPLADADMQRFADFALSLVLPPNPVRSLDNQLGTGAALGRSFFLDAPSSANGSCETCHRIDSSLGFFGTGTFASAGAFPQTMKVPHLRNLYAKVGMFGMLRDSGGGADDTGPQVRGFGYAHEGAVDTLFRFVSGAGFTFPSDIERHDVEAFLLQFDNDIAPIVGQQVTLTASNADVAGPRIDLLIARAAAPFESLLLGGSTTECEVVVKGAIAGASRGWVRLASGLFQRDDDPGQTALVCDAALREQVASVGPLTYTCVAPGSGVRVGINRDLDAHLDAHDNCPGNVNDDQVDFDQDGLGDPCDPTPTPEPGLAVGIAAAVGMLVGLRRRGSGLRNTNLSPEGS